MCSHLKYDIMFLLYSQTPLHRQRHPQEDDSVSGWPLLQDAEDQNPPNGWTRSWVASQWNDQGSTLSHIVHLCCFVFLSSALRMLLLPQGQREGGMRPVVDKHNAQLHKDITWHDCIMRLCSGQWNGSRVSKSDGGMVGCVSSVNPGKRNW